MLLVKNALPGLLSSVTHILGAVGRAPLLATQPLGRFALLAFQAWQQVLLFTVSLCGETQSEHGKAPAQHAMVSVLVERGHEPIGRFLFGELQTVAKRALLHVSAQLLRGCGTYTL